MRERIDDPETEDVDIDFELGTAGAETECKDYLHDPSIEPGYGENCPTPNKFPFCRYCCWQPDQLDQFWMRERQHRILEEARRKGLV